MDVLYREHERRLFLYLRLQHPWLNGVVYFCAPMVRATECCAADVRRKLLTCDLWLALCLVTCHQRICHRLQRHRQLLTHHWANMFYSFYLFSSSLEWLLCCHIWQMAITSVKCFWIHGWVPWAAPRQAFWIWLQGHHLSKQYWGLLGSFWLTFDSRFQGNKTMPAACLSPNTLPSSRHPLYLSDLVPVPTLFLVFLLENWESLFNLAVSLRECFCMKYKNLCALSKSHFLCKLPLRHFIRGGCLFWGEGKQVWMRSW